MSQLEGARSDEEEEIRGDLIPDGEFPLVEFRNEEKLVELSGLLSCNGMSVREAEVHAVDALDMDTHAMQEDLRDLARMLEVEMGEIHNHHEASEQRFDDATNLHYMLKETLPKQVIGRVKVGSQKADVDSLIITVARSFDYSTEQPSEDDEEYTLFIAKYENTGWQEAEYRGEDVRRVTGRRRVLGELNRILKDFKSNNNPLRVVGEMMYALDISEGSLDPSNEYSVRMELANPLCNPEGPPEEYEKPPNVFGGSSSLVQRFEKEESDE